MRRKQRLTEKLIEYLADPENDFPSRSEMSVKILGYKNRQSVYTLFRPEELTEIEHRALEERKRRSSRVRAQMYKALHELGLSGNVQAIKELLDRLEGKVTEKHEHSGRDGGPILTDTERSHRILALVDAARKRGA